MQYCMLNSSTTIETFYVYFDARLEMGDKSNKQHGRHLYVGGAL